MEGRSFKEDLRVIKLGGSDIVLGNDWMKKFNPTKFDHEKHCVTIRKKGNKMVLHAIPERQPDMITSSIMGKILKKGQTLLTHLLMLKGDSEFDKVEVAEAIQQFLSRYEMLFGNLNITT